MMESKQVETDEIAIEPCGRCGAPVPAGYGVCDNCACDLRHEAEDYHQRMLEAYERGEL